MLLMPGIPMLFQGQEFAASSPFFYFADNENPLSEEVRAGRATFLKQFPSLSSAEMQAQLPDPSALGTFHRSILHRDQHPAQTQVFALHRDLLALRRDDRVFGKRPCRVDGAILADDAWLLRYFAKKWG